MKPRFSTEGWWVASMSLLVFSNLILAYWVICETFGWANGRGLGDFLYWITFFPGMFLAPLAAILGFYTALGQVKSGHLPRSAILAFLTGGAALCAWIAWEAFLTGGR